MKKNEPAPETAPQPPVAPEPTEPKRGGSVTIPKEGTQNA